MKSAQNLDVRLDSTFSLPRIRFYSPLYTFVTSPISALSKILMHVLALALLLIAVMLSIIGRPATTLSKLHDIQNLAARVLTHYLQSAHITPLLYHYNGFHSLPTFNIDYFWLLSKPCTVLLLPISFWASTSLYPISHTLVLWWQTAYSSPYQNILHRWQVF